MGFLLKLACSLLLVASQSFIEPEPIAVESEMVVQPETTTVELSPTPVVQGETTSDHKVVHHPKDVHQPDDESLILTWWEYVHTYEGLCPHEQPVHELKGTWQWLAAIGATSVDRSPEQVLEQMWSYWREGTLGGQQDLLLSDGSWLHIDWDTLTVQDDPFHTDLIRGFEERYLTHCPND